MRPEQIPAFSLSSARRERSVHAAVTSFRRPQVVQREAVLQRISHPRPPPSVNPAMPVVPTTPPVVARPCSCVSRLNSCQRPRCLGAGGSTFGIHVGALHQREIEHQTRRRIPPCRRRCDRRRGQRAHKVCGYGRISQRRRYRRYPDNVHKSAQVCGRSYHCEFLSFRRPSGFIRTQQHARKTCGQIGYPA